MNPNIHKSLCAAVITLLWLPVGCADRGVSARPAGNGPPAHRDESTVADSKSTDSKLADFQAEVSRIGDATAWRDTFEARLEALALMQTLNAELLSHDSATLTLERWCDAHRQASPAHILAARVIGQDKLPTADQRRELGVSPTEPVRYRRVQLRCGALVLSEADNWYVPGRLTTEMNTLLDTTDAPFGKVVQALHFQRHTLSSTLLWRPLPEGWEMMASSASNGAEQTVPRSLIQDRAESSALPPPLKPGAELSIPPYLLQQRAVLTLPDGTPFSEVVEKYTKNILAFPAPHH